MAEPMATKAELTQLRKRGMEVTPKNLRIIRIMMEQDKKNNKIPPQKPSGGMSKKNISKRSEPTGMAKGGMVKKKYSNCGASVPASRKSK